MRIVDIRRAHDATHGAEQLVVTRVGSNQTGVVYTDTITLDGEMIVKLMTVLTYVAESKDHPLSSDAVAVLCALDV